ncbi:sensor histidine kinase (plasmid) [Sphingobium sp. V4]|uniref:sensor histidine kinase n=1 Tax=Sphingobium sp. V4 TaxID=3038927 RepID=UPI002558216A|nr:sensor histidine kinase [Sphingobium sp. V4]WIW90240.1 sensor histidine kinase [Sphingobium sp. V4]
MLVSITDATEQHQRDVAKDLLFGELRHRVKNLFGVIQAVASQTTTSGCSAEEYRDAFLGRLAALIEAEDLAFGEQEASDLPELLKRVFAPYAANPGVIAIQPGEPVVLIPGTIMSLALIFHEMATNAVKYGALSVPGGQVKVCWLLDDGGETLTVKWSEIGGPPVNTPTAPGYGTHLIQWTTTYSLRGKVDLEYASDGLKAEIVIPLGCLSRRLTATDAEEGSDRRR